MIIMPLTTITVTGTWLKIDGTPASGKIIMTPVSTVTGSSVIVTEEQIVAYINPTTGAIPATNVISQDSISTLQILVEEHIDNAKIQRYIVNPTGLTLDLPSAPRGVENPSPLFVTLSNGHIPSSQLGSGLQDGSTFLRSDGTWQVPATGGGTGAVASVNGKTGAVVLSATDITTGVFGPGQIPSLPESQIAGLTTDLAAKAINSTVVHNSGSETVNGIKTFTSSPIVPINSFPESAITNLTVDLAAKAADSAVVHTTGDETVNGIKTFVASPVGPDPTIGNQLATKEYVDNQFASGTAPDATTTSKGIVQLAGDLAGTAIAPTVPALASKANDSAVVHNTTAETIAGVKTFSSSPIVPNPIGTTDAANKTYVDTAVAGVSVADATTTSKGIIELAGDLSGTAAAPTVPALSNKANDNAVVHLSGAETIAGIKTFSSAPIVPSNAFPESAIVNLASDLAAKAADSAVVHNTGIETIAGIKTFTSAPVVPSSSFPESAITNLTTDLAAKAPLASPTFTGTVTVPTPVNSTDASTKAYVDSNIQGLTTKQSVSCASAAALPANTYSVGVLTATATGILTVDGVIVNVNDRVLVKNEATAANNGIYSCTTAGATGVAYVLTRSTDFNQAADIPGAYVFVENGTVNSGAGFVIASSGPYAIGTTAITWTQFSGAGEITVSTGLTKTGNQLSIDSTVATLTGVQTVTNKTMSGSSNTFSAIPETAVTNLTADLAAKALNSAVVHNTGAETVAGIKTFSSTISGSIDGTAATVLTNANLTGDVTSVGNATTYANSVPVLLGGTGATASTGSGNNVLATSPTLVTPVLGVASATTINKVTLTAPITSATITISDGKILTVNNSITIAGVDATTLTFQGTDTYVGRATTDTLTNKTISGSSNTISAIPESAVTNLTTDLAAKATDSLTMHLAGTETVTGVKTFNDSTVKFAGSTSGTTIVKATAVAGATTLTLPSATDTLIAKATTDTLTNKTLDTAGTGNIFKVNGTQLSSVTGTGAVVLAASPTLTGTPLAPTATQSSNNTQIATTAYVDNRCWIMKSTDSLATAGSFDGQIRDTTAKQTPGTYDRWVASSSSWVTVDVITGSSGARYYQSAAVSTGSTNQAWGFDTAAQTSNWVTPSLSNTTWTLSQPGWWHVSSGIRYASGSIAPDMYIKQDGVIVVEEDGQSSSGFWVLNIATDIFVATTSTVVVFENPVATTAPSGQNCFVAFKWIGN